MLHSLLLAVGPFLGSWQTSPSPIEVHVDTRVELMTALARVAGFAEYATASSNSPYSRRVEQYFGPLGDHPVFGLLQRLRAERGISFDAVTSFAVHIDAVATCGELVPFDPLPERLDSRFDPTVARELLAAVRDLVEVSEAEAFFEEERPFYAQVEARLAERLAESRALPWFDRVFGERPATRYVAVPGLLCGGGNYGVGVRHPGRPEEISPIFGCAGWDAEGLPTFGPEMLPLAIHELCHSYTNAWVDRFAAELEGPITKLAATQAEAMQRQAYGTWRAVAYETLVRACVVRCRAATEGPEAGAQQALEEAGRGFLWVPALAEALGEFEADRERWPDLASFLPRVIEVLERAAQ